ncbi:hypothetical protein PGIGA_G00117970 [Pangasianodon gigas]|uniref:Uncharacterized protein n=1 Tax=Pangasianodon gigas TaxID=30993 RepID=A0ACC5XFC9_PANGG|nr:hypothetical protein [Pangasianodon gigas]
MKLTGVLLMVCLSVVQPQTFPDISAIVNGPVTLPCTCSGQKVEWSIFHPRLTKSFIASCHHETCQIDQHFQKRFSVLVDTSRGNFSMSISSALYNDFGFYRCTCNGKSVSEVKLKVYDPRIVMVFEGDNVTLPCYGDTRRDAKDVQWKKDGKKLLEYLYGTTNASAGRFMMSEEGFLDGDLSLHISTVHLSDAGFYLCLIQGESRDGDPRAVLLKVEERQPEHQPPTPPNSYIQLALGVTLGLFLGGFIGVIIYCVRRFRRPQDTTSTNIGAPVQEEFQMIPKPSSTLPIQD